MIVSGFQFYFHQMKTFDNFTTFLYQFVVYGKNRIFSCESYQRVDQTTFAKLNLAKCGQAAKSGLRGNLFHQSNICATIPESIDSNY